MDQAALQSNTVEVCIPYGVATWRWCDMIFIDPFMVKLRSHWLKPFGSSLAQGRIGSNPVGLGNLILTQGTNIHLG